MTNHHPAVIRATEGYRWREGDRVHVLFEEYIHQPGISKYQSNQYHPRTDYTTARAWKVGTITKIKGVMAHVKLDGKYKQFRSGWVPFTRLQPYVW